LALLQLAAIANRARSLPTLDLRQLVVDLMKKRQLPRLPALRTQASSRLGRSLELTLNNLGWRFVEEAALSKPNA